MGIACSVAANKSVAFCYHEMISGFRTLAMDLDVPSEMIMLNRRQSRLLSWVLD